MFARVCWLTILLAGCARLPERSADAMRPSTLPPQAGGPTAQQNQVTPSRDCPAGMMRVPEGSYPASVGPPSDTTHVHAFCIDKTEVTTQAYTACVRAGTCSANGLRGRACNYGVRGANLHPINCVDWYQAAVYCASLGNRLPTEQEWEFAARGADGRAYPWGDDEPSDQLCWNRNLGTCPVGYYPFGDSPFGLQDMAGNVSEWTSSWSIDHAGKPGDERVYRGGAWVNISAEGLRPTPSAPPSFRDAYLGFRCAR